MTRTEFTLKIAQLIFLMAKDDFPVMDFVMRSQSEQKRLFDAGLSKCDGKIKISRHQLGLAMDIYFLDDKGNIDFGYESQRAKDCAVKYHDIWVTMGGKPMISWDKSHYEA
ncbi:MAG: hypothetical protein WC390_09180 [Sulfurimonas sp.]|jgi:hypothetical protein